MEFNRFEKIIPKDVTKKFLELKKNKSFEIKDDDIKYASSFAKIEAKEWEDLLLVINKYPKKFEAPKCIIGLYIIELYLKAILLAKGVNITSKEYKREHRDGHSIIGMYNLLSEEEKEIVKRNIDIDKDMIVDFLGEESIHFNSFEEELEFISSDFVNLRYEYEKYMRGLPIIPLKDFIYKLKDNLKILAKNIKNNQ